MAVNYTTPAAHMLRPIAGVRLGTTCAEIRKAGRRDLTLVELVPGTRVAGVFTQNRYCAAPVVLCRQHIASGDIRALVIITGIANAGTGATGIAAAQTTCDAVASLLGVRSNQVLPFSTGVILEPLPVDKLVAGLPACQAALSDTGWHDAAHAIMTTDTVAKAASLSTTIDDATISITGISKGAGMIKPNMATMLGFVATDAAVSQAVLQQLVKEAAAASFNCITVDGDTSTNDSFVVIATGRAGNPEITRADSDAYVALRTALTAVAVELAQAIVRDGEGATKFIEIDVAEGRTEHECKQVAYAIAHSPLVKTAFFASDPNLGRILCAIGNAALPDLDANLVKVWLADTLVAECGGRAASYREEDGARAMAPAEITLRVALGRGQAHAKVWTCDLSYDYVKINADYRS